MASTVAAAAHQRVSHVRSRKNMTVRATAAPVAAPTLVTKRSEEVRAAACRRPLCRSPL